MTIEELKKEAREEIKAKVLSVADTNMTVSWSFIEDVFNKYIDRATKLERDRWLHQSTNEHDKQIRLDERKRCAEIARTFKVEQYNGEESVFILRGSKIATAILNQQDV